MSWLSFALIAFIALWIYERNRNQRLRHENAMLREDMQRTGALPGAADDQDDFDSRELRELRERVQVLERIATDENSSEARKAQRIAEEIESLRGDIARRSSRDTEEVSK